MLHAKKVALVLLIFKVCFNKSSLANEDINFCPGVEGCRCVNNTQYPRNHSEMLKLYCKQVDDPKLENIPHDKIANIIIRECNFHSLQTLKEIRKTKAAEVSLIRNTFPKVGFLDFDWNWLPDMTSSISLTNNGFRGFTDSNTTPKRCENDRFENITILIVQENFTDLLQCLPSKTSRMLLNRVPSPFGDHRSLKNFTWPKQLSLFKITEGGLENIHEDLFINSPPTLSTLWIGYQQFKDGRWPRGLPHHSLTKLIISYCNLKVIPPEEIETLHRVNKLEFLQLSYNNLTEIPMRLPSSLTALNLHRNRIAYIDPSVWETVTNLRRLDLSDNLLTMTPLGMPASLVILILKNNEIEHSSEEAFTHIKNLTKLDFSGNRLVAMPRGIQPGIFSYFLQNNQISLIQGPQDYDFCENCHTMWVEGNPLYCDQNMLEMLFWLSRNNINVGYGYTRTKCGGSFSGREKNMTWISLILDYMSYYRKPPNDVCIYKIKTLICEEGSLNKVPKLIPPDLIRISISHNLNLTFVEDYKFHNQKKLVNLYLQNNSLTHIPYGLPQNLKRLRLTNNKIKELNKRDVEALSSLTSLTTLYLNNNQIKTLYPQQFANLKNLEYIGLSENHLSCDCSLLPFTIWYERYFVDRTIVTNTPTCYTPLERRYQDIIQQWGYYRFKLQCAPANCDWSDKTTVLNCSAHTQNSNDQYTATKFELGLAPYIPTSSYWEVLDLTGLKLEDGAINLTHLENLKTVVLSDNNLTRVAFGQLPTKLEILILSKNLITTLPDHKKLLEHLPNLRVIDLSNNRIEFLKSSALTLLPLVKKVLLEGNPLVCNCSLRPFANWIQVNGDNEELTQDHNLMSLQCFPPGSVLPKTIMNTTEAEYCPPKDVSHIIIGSVIGIVLTAIVVFIITFYLQQRQKVKNERVKEEILLGFQGLLANETEDSVKDPETGINPNNQPFRFDAFVSYDPDGQDAEFVIELLEELEDSRGYKLCLNERDFMPGAGITDNIVECIGASRHVVLILSKDFAASPWCQYEVQVALVELHQRRKSKLLIPLMLEDLSTDSNLAASLQTCLSIVPHIDVPDKDDAQNREKFWEELVDIMPRSVDCLA